MVEEEAAVAVEAAGSAADSKVEVAAAEVAGVRADVRVDARWSEAVFGVAVAMMEVVAAEAAAAEAQAAVAAILAPALALFRAGAQSEAVATARVARLGRGAPQLWKRSSPRARRR